MWQAAADFNERRVAQDFPDAWARRAADGVPGDGEAGSGTMVFAPGMRIRLTQNVDKDRGFVNGAVGTIVEVLQKSVFILRTDHRVLILVHPVCRPGKGSFDSEYVAFMPCTYGYAKPTPDGLEHRSGPPEDRFRDRFCYGNLQAFKNSDPGDRPCLGGCANVIPSLPQTVLSAVWGRGRCWDQFCYRNLQDFVNSDPGDRPCLGGGRS